jgi:hypothetical protein
MEENEQRVKVICDRLSRMHEPSIETEGGNKVLYNSVLGARFSYVSFEVGPELAW